MANLAANFTVVSGHSVPNNFSWDNGVPFSTTSPLVCTVLLPQGGIITGNASGVKVFIKNDSILSTTTTNFTSISAQYIWNFNDFYNTDNDTYTLTCSADISHVYIMPGSYETTLTVVETYQLVDPLTQLLLTKTQTNTSTKSVCVVQEIPPQANLYSVTQPTIGQAPLSVRLTARTTIPGSFPVDRILWDFGDGSERLLVSRYYNKPNSNLVNNGVFTNDSDDPRNYDVLHTYSRKCNTYPVFYPSITAYSSSTNTLDTCSLTIGPILLSTTDAQFHILKGRNTTYGNLYSAELDKNITFVATQSAIGRTYSLTPTVPPNLIRNSFGQPVLSLGNPGTDYYTVSGLC
jgi:hypothetical protein